METEIASLYANDTWTPVAAPSDAPVMDTKFVFVTKHKRDGTIDRHKARLVAKGFQQGNVHEVYAPVIDFTNLRVVLACALSRGGIVHQLDVKTAFLNGKLDEKEEVYVRPPPGIDFGLQEGEVLKLRRALYGLKRAPRIWSKTWSDAVASLGYRRLKSDECVFVRSDHRGMVVLLVYVDDILVVAWKNSTVRDVKKELMGLFEMRDMGRVSKFLGVLFEHRRNGTLMTQRTYTEEVLKRFGMHDSKPVTTPMARDVTEACEKPQDYTLQKLGQFKEVIGALLYLSTRTRPDIATAVNFLARDSSAPTDGSWIGVKRVLRYLRGTKDLGLFFKNGARHSLPEMEVYSDADWAGDLKDRKSTSGMTISLNGVLIAWHSRKQQAVAMSSSEAEYIALSDCAKEVIWIRQLLGELGWHGKRATVIHEDNIGAIKWGKSDKRTKHVDIRYHFVRDMVQRGAIELEYCSTNLMLADVMTKALLPTRFKALRERFMNDGGRDFGKKGYVETRTEYAEDTTK